MLNTIKKGSYLTLKTKNRLRRFLYKFTLKLKINYNS